MSVSVNGMLAEGLEPTLGPAAGSHGGLEATVHEFGEVLHPWDGRLPKFAEGSAHQFGVGLACGEAQAVE